MEQVKNFRDLGGIKSGEDRIIKKGLFYRSATLDFASDDDIEELKSLKLKHVFDYRGKEESLGDSADDKIGAKHNVFPVELNNKALYKLQKRKSVKGLLRGVKLSDVMETYKYLPFDNAGYRAMFAAFENGETPFLQHCSAGKDRAGMGSALLLFALGASYDDVLTDYLKSNAVRDYVRETAGKIIPRPFREFVLKRLEPLFIVDRELLDSALTAIKVKYGDIDVYFEKEFNLTPEKLSALRLKYTDNFEGNYE